MCYTLIRVFKTHKHLTKLLNIFQEITNILGHISNTVERVGSELNGGGEEKRKSYKQERVFEG